MSVGILAYGSLVGEPGIEIKPLIIRRIETMTPFAVEYVRSSGTRGGAPTVAPHKSGQPVRAEILVLSDAVSADEATNLLWRREVRQEGTGKVYQPRDLPNALLVVDWPGLCGIDHVLYTDFHSAGKNPTPDPRALAEAAIASVSKAKPGKDGISYLIALLAAGIETALTAGYVREVLNLTGASSLAAALEIIQRGGNS